MLGSLEFGAQSLLQGIEWSIQPDIDLQYAFPPTEEFLYYFSIKEGGLEVEEPKDDLKLEAEEEPSENDYDYYGRTFVQYESIMTLLKDVLHAQNSSARQVSPFLPSR